MKRAADGVSERVDQPHRYFSFYTSKVKTFAASLDSVLSLHSPTPPTARGEFRPRQTRQLPRAVDLKGRLLSCQSY